MVNFTVWLIVGGIIGWLASILMVTNAQEERLRSVVVGIVPHGAEVGATQTTTNSQQCE